MNSPGGKTRVVNRFKPAAVRIAAVGLRFPDLGHHQQLRQRATALRPVHTTTMDVRSFPQNGGACQGHITMALALPYHGSRDRMGPSL